jgi:hypothetical protein
MSVDVPQADVREWLKHAFYPVAWLYAEGKKELRLWTEENISLFTAGGKMTWDFGLRQFTAIR